MFTDLPAAQAVRKDLYEVSSRGSNSRRLPKRNTQWQFCVFLTVQFTPVIMYTGMFRY